MRDFHWIKTSLASDSPRSQARALPQLLHAGTEGLPFLPRLLDLCDGVGFPPRPETIDYTIVLYATRSTGAILHATGFNENDKLHERGCRWIHSVADSNDVNAAAIGIWALGDLGTPPTGTVDRLVECIHTDDRFDPSGVHSIRSIAFRMLAGIDRPRASALVDTLACREHMAAMSAWIADAQNRPDGHFDPGPELTTEVAWLLT